MSDPVEPAAAPPAAPPTTQGDFVPVKPPETWPTVIGVISIIFGSLGVLSGACGGAFLLLSEPLLSLVPEEQASEMELQVSNSMPYPVMQGGVMLLELVISVLMLVGGIMLLRRKRSARGLLVGTACLDLISNTVAAVVGFLVVQAQMKAMQENAEVAQQMPATFGTFAQGAGGVMVFVQWLFLAIWPVFVLIWFSRRRIRESVEAWE
ncbi:MAG: hypothetical protein HND58_18150 [Planctomycetota bacterium]|nr:MAG: hypothetical protein HND58_18150 [Planctomycetota bacterium]